TDVSLFAADPLAGRTLGRRLGGFDRLTTPSLAHAELAHRLLALRSLPDVVHNSVEPRSSAAAIRRTWSPPRIAHVSSFRPVKDPALMAEVYLRLRRSTEAELWLIGDGPGLASTRERIREGGHLEDVRVFGVRTDVEPLLRRTDVCAVTSRTESFSLAALEAAACGLPVVAPRVGGIPEVVLDGRTGLLLPGGDATAAVRALERLLRDPALRARLGAAAAVRARAFSTARAADAYERIYRSVLGVSVASGPEPAPAGRGAGPPAAGSSRPPAGGSRRSR
ncbi:MAG TPA: glycosyltransferase, partial [Actinomycetota bacterium]|nr:glycosyltransferase [Actinomycetota bacterium]